MAGTVMPLLFNPEEVCLQFTSNGSFIPLSND